ncbi:MAG: hypothetical protein QOH90_2034 [Actinomycetota bacterium]|nr:hypothetical protein [Actinomycetota bacterium]
MKRTGRSERAGRNAFLCLLLVSALTVPAFAQSSSSITIQPDCGPETTGQSDEPHYEITVNGSGFEADKDVEINFAGERQDDPNQQDVVADQSGNFSTTIRPTRRSAGSYDVEALQRHGEGSVSSRSTTVFTVPCPESTTTTTEPSQEPSPPTTTTQPGQEPSPSPSPTKKPGHKKKEKNDQHHRFKPHLSFGSSVATPGSVVEVTGRGFPKGKKLLLDWNVGAGSLRTKANARGRFKVGMLVFPNDLLGPRRLVVTGRRFEKMRVKFLVVPGTAAPPDFSNR